MDKIAGVTFIETYSHVSVWAILVLVLGVVFFVLTLVSLTMTAEKDDTKYIPTFCIFLAATVICPSVYVVSRAGKGIPSKSRQHKRLGRNQFAISNDRFR